MMRSQMSFGVQRSRTTEPSQSGKRLVKAITTETIVCLVVVVALFTAFAWTMGLAQMFKTMMGTAHDLILNTVLFLMAVIILAGAATSFLSEFGVVGIANRILSKRGGG